MLHRSYSQVGECSEGEERISVDNSDLVSTEVSVENHKPGQFLKNLLK